MADRHRLPRPGQSTTPTAQAQGPSLRHRMLRRPQVRSCYNYWPWQYACLPANLPARQVPGRDKTRRNVKRTMTAISQEAVAGVWPVELGEAAITEAWPSIAAYGLGRMLGR